MFAWERKRENTQLDNVSISRRKMIPKGSSRITRSFNCRLNEFDIGSCWSHARAWVNQSKRLSRNERGSSTLRYAKLSLSRSLLRRSTSERRRHRLALSIEPTLHNWINNGIGTSALWNEHRCHNYFQCFKSTVAAKSLPDLPRKTSGKDQPAMVFIAVNLVSPPLCIARETYSSLISLLHLYHALLSTRTSASMRDTCTHPPPPPTSRLHFYINYIYIYIRETTKLDMLH